MKNIYIVQNSNLSFDLNIAKLYSPAKYRLFLIVNKFGLTKLNERNQQRYFDKIWQTDDFTLDHLKTIISDNQRVNDISFQIVTNAEEAVVVCGNLRVFFEIDTQNYDRFKNKILMKKLLNNAGLLTPKYIQFDRQVYLNNPSNYVAALSKKLQFPIIAKPIDSMGCIGILKINSNDELANWCKDASLTEDTYEIDEYIHGKVYNCDSFIKDNKIVFTQISECSNTCYDFICGMTKGTIALPHNDPLYKELCDYTRKVHEAISMPQGGVTHLEVIKTENNYLYFIEIGHRSPGILIPAMYKKFLNIDTIESHILLQIDEDFDLQINQGPYCAWIAFPSKSGRLVKKHIPAIQSEYQLEWNYQEGDIMINPSCGRDYTGRVLLWNNDYLQLRFDFDYLNSYQFFDVENARPTTQS